MGKEWALGHIVDEGQWSFLGHSCSADLFPIAHGQSWPNFWKKARAQDPVLTAFLLTAFPSSSLSGSLEMQEALCRGSALYQPLQQEAAEIPRHFYSTSLFLFIYFSSLPLELQMRARKMQEDALFSFPPTQRCKIPLNGWE